MEYEGEEYLMYDEFEQEFADELEMAASLDPDTKVTTTTTTSTSTDRYEGMSRRNLSLTSPFQSGATNELSRKRPVDNESENPLTPAKHPRLEDNTPPHDSQNHTVTPSQTPQAHTVTNGNLRTPSRRSLPNASIPRSTHITASAQSTIKYGEEDLLTPSKTTPTSSSLFRCSKDSSDNYAKMAIGSSSFQSPKHTQAPLFDDELPSDSQTISQDQRSGKYQQLYALSRAPPGPHMTVTSSDGSRVYLRIDKGQRSGSEPSFLNSQLLSVPIAELRAAVEEEQREKLLRESDFLLQSLRESMEEDGTQEVIEGVVSEGDSHAGHVLWVDKYSPHNYTDLLSDDGVNRTLLSWLRLWDEVVFNRPLPLKPSAGLAKQGVGGAKVGGGGANPGKKETPRGKKFEKRIEVQDPSTFAGQDALDDSRRPKIKLALLCGAPGLGKTTLAHVIATHAGYNVVEMNASDDRSPEIFKQRIEAATQMQAVLTATTKPNCLIIDEIDGAPTAAINTLIDYVTKKTKASGKKKGDTSSLSRPIICICNDQYAPSLRQLRQHSLLLHFPPIVTSRLASRLQQVTKQEKLVATISTLIALCEKTNNDIRSCLNTIQFIGRKSKDISLGSIQIASIGQKDAQRSLFSFWKEVFQLPTSKKHTLNQGPLRMSSMAGVGSHGNSTAHLSTNAGRFHHILMAAFATGEGEKVANGLFENYLLARVRDPNLEAISVAQDWLVFNDRLLSHIGHTQDYLFMSYLPFLSIAFHFLFASSSKANLKYPNTSYEVFLRTQRSQHLLSSLLLEATPTIRCTINSTLLVTEILSPLSEIIAPSFRPVSIQLYSAQEKQQLLDLVGTMISYNLTYRQERGSDGQYTYVLDPNIEELCRFPGLPQRKQLSYSAKQLISREVEMEKMRRTERLLKSIEGGPASKQSVANDSKLQTQRPAYVKPVPKTMVMETDKPPTDFFGRPVTPSRAKAGRKAIGGGANFTHPLWFKFNEGYSNAVRRPIKIKILL